MTPKSFFESFSSANVIENLHTQLRLRDGELHQFQEEAAKNERIRKSLNEEIAQLTIQNQELLLQMENLTDLQNRLEEVEKKYNTVLQLYGEKVEEAEELRLDLEDVKKMYTEQIDKLFER
jgi:chromosome segregation ATPase